jgi:hypothetical protein
MVATSWTVHEWSLLRALALQTPCLTREQILRGWRVGENDSTSVADASLARLLNAKLIESCVIEAHPLLPLAKPLFAWKPGDPPPSERRIKSLSEQALQRWELPHVAATVYVASRSAARLFGAFVAALPIKHCETNHQLHLSEVFMCYRKTRPKFADAWLGEAAFPKLGFDVKGMKHPDAFLLDAEGRAQRVVEFVGSYPAEHLERFHEHCAGQAARRMAQFLGTSSQSPLQHLYQPEGTAYELW